ncbi:hypothetical protein N7495_003235 [Penicillium taxi]|uniref:uncharacterized protein n=1 Tax=Penicillium taxi TaxID=168475 RepID=UPI0025455BBC|nr:uncharacterized protein N7495_003235 [Penicillium taxi]KAJ5902707.1 hypothetical protein N7495_003235 [Penicillium taxi]
MTAPRLQLLYPNLSRVLRAYRLIHRRHISPTSPRNRFYLHTSRQLGQQAYHRRYGPAVERNVTSHKNSTKNTSNEIPDGAPTDEEVENITWETSPSEESQSEPQLEAQAETQPKSPESKSELDQDHQIDDAAAASLSEQAAANSVNNSSTKPEESTEQTAESDSTENNRPSTPREPGEGIARTSQHTSSKDFEQVYHMPSPSTGLASSDSPNPKLSQMSPTPYVHHFDTYSLVLDLEKGGFTEEQSITIMKAVRGILYDNLNFAKQSLTSKSDHENESYLFKAACSELQQSLRTARDSEIQRQRASRGQLEHETDILSQRLNQDSAAMKDDIKAMFNDHKMSTREQQRIIDTSVQELNYKITVSLNSDSKSEIEGLRWILTRRAALAIASCAFMIIVFLKVASTHKEKPSPKTAKEDLKMPAVKELVTETRVVHHPGPGIQDTRPHLHEEHAHLGESLG